MEENIIDFDEKAFLKEHSKVLEILLLDNTSKKNIIWATDSYASRGIHFSDPITLDIICSKDIVKPRVNKSKNELQKRIKVNGEVFTPSWVVNKQNNSIDRIWFDGKDVFNIENDNNGWTTIKDKIPFSETKTHIDYLKDLRIEITCGEGPYLVSRYDTVTGEFIKVENRIGLLDRKFRVVNENSSSKEEWIEKAFIALKATYGYEWQGDNLLLARENVLLTYIDYYQSRFNEMPNDKLLEEVAFIISWNLWQMDGIKCVIPNSCKTNKVETCNIFGEVEIVESGCEGCQKDNHALHNGIYSKIMDWDKNKPFKYASFVTGGFVK